jgi:glutathione peroxidase
MVRPPDPPKNFADRVAGGVSCHSEKESTVLKMLIPGALMALSALSLALHAQAPASSASAAAARSFYDLKTKTLEGKPADLAAYKGKVSLVVNVASKCGYTPQYEGLEKLHSELHDKGFNVLGFPSNDFGGQEPGTPEEIRTFCKLTYGVTFPMFEKVVTHQGTEQSPVYGFLSKSGNLPKWNFSKYVVGKDGKVLAFFPSAVTPEDPALRAAISKALAQ